MLPVKLTPVAYYYPDEVVEHKDGLSRGLVHVVRLLNLLGYSLATPSAAVTMNIVG